MRGRKYAENQAIPYIIVTVAEELSKNIDSHDSQACVCFDFEDSQDCLV